MSRQAVRVLVGLFVGLLAGTVILAITAIWTVDPAVQVRFANTVGVVGMLAFVVGVAALIGGVS